MALDPNTAFINTDGTPFPDNEAVNASGPTATDGTEYVKNMIDNFMFGPQQALLNFAGLIPDGVPEADGTSQEIEAMQKSFGFPGESVLWYGNNDPASLGAKILLLQGQGISVATYSNLLASVYVGDGDNGTAKAFFRADDALGAVRNTGGAFLILPDARGRVLRALDDTGLIDPDGASRLPGDSQEDAYQGHHHYAGLPNVNDRISGSSSTSASINQAADVSRVGGHDSVTDGVNGTPRVEIETRSKNLSAHFGIRY